MGSDAERQRWTGSSDPFDISAELPEELVVGELLFPLLGRLPITHPPCPFVQVGVGPVEAVPNVAIHPW